MIALNANGARWETATTEEGADHNANGVTTDSVV